MTAKIDALHQLLENFPISAWVLTESGEITYMNREMHSLFGEHEGKSSSIIYDSGRDVQDAVVKQTDGVFTNIMLADMPFRTIGVWVDLGEDGRFRVEYFEDVAEKKLLRDSMRETLQKVRRETQIAKTIQNRIIPKDNIYDETIEVHAFYQPADDLGGDFFDIVNISEDEYLIYIADVSGHGIQAALLTVYLHERVRANIEAAKDGPARLLGKIAGDFNSLEVDATLYATMVLCKYDKRRHEMLIANAGHGCYPLILRGNGRTETVPIQGLPVCAIADENSYEDEIIGMQPGDRLILYTDGIVEEFDMSKGGTFGQEGVRAVAEKYKDCDGRYVAYEIADEAAKYVLLNAKDDRTIVVADILA
ncbi:MAG: SpoIIE family protein phosphatase [Clostridiales Family XIII bacterium]|jgi:sigma-B regulation protein RsbU (phosphoserine phosphatase)|nr:SpoIIE family protein phosphatase [Clostridiales Family XIII bacterium]